MTTGRQRPPEPGRRNHRRVLGLRHEIQPLRNQSAYALADGDWN
jgi:hypothetical protein